MHPESDLARADPAHSTLAQDLCARVCHDLGGPLGSIAGALELVGQEGEAVAVARESAESATRRLMLWRAVGGAGTGPLERVALALLLDGALPGGRAAADLSGLAAAELQPPVARALLAAAMLGAEALPRGGTVHVGGAPGGLSVRPEGRGAGWPPGLGAALAGEAVRGPREVLAPLLLTLAGEAGLRAELDGGGAGAGGVPDAAPPTLWLR